MLNASWDIPQRPTTHVGIKYLKKKKNTESNKIDSRQDIQQKQTIKANNLNLSLKD